VEYADQIPQPVRFYLVITVNGGNDTGILVSMRQGVIQSAGLETRQLTHMEITETLSKSAAPFGHRPPYIVVAGIVVDPQYFEVRIVEPGQRVQGLDQHGGWFVAARHVNGHLWSSIQHHRHWLDLATSSRIPMCLRPFMRLRKEHSNDTQHSNNQQQPH